MDRASLALLAGTAALVVVALAGGVRAASLAPLIGRSHAALVHLPIGALLASALLDWIDTRQHAGHAGGHAGMTGAALLRLLGAWSALLAATAGVLLADWGSYPPGALQQHKWLGMITAVAAVAWYIVRDGMARPVAMRTAAIRSGTVVLGALLLVGGHLGGTLVRGDDYLTRYLPQPVRDVAGLPDAERLTRRHIANAQATPVYDSIVQPLLTQRCTSCHNPARTMGSLDLTSARGLFAGGRQGKVLVPGHADDSELIARLELPPGHLDAMPPDRAIPASEIAVLRWWIDQGASTTVTLADIARPSEVRRTLEAYGLDDVPSGVFALQIPAPDTAAMTRARNTGLTVQRAGRDVPLLSVSATNVPAAWTAGALPMLQPLAAQVIDLNLARTNTGDSALVAMGRMPHLVQLQLSYTQVSDAGLAHLRGLQHLEVLNLVGTRVSDAGLRALDSLPRLRALYLMETSTTADGIARLRRAHPRLRIVGKADSLVTPPARTAVATAPKAGA